VVDTFTPGPIGCLGVSFSENKLLHIFRLAAIVALLGGLLSCSTPQRRAQQRAAAFNALSTEDQQQVLHGRIRPGLSQEAVYIAWGEPDWIIEGGKGGQTLEKWIYFSALTHYAPMGSADQRYSAVGDFYGPRPSPWNYPGLGYDGLPNGGILYPSRVILTEARYKRAEFVDGKVQSFVARRGGSWLLPANSGGPVSESASQMLQAQALPSSASAVGYDHSLEKKRSSKPAAPHRDKPSASAAGSGGGLRHSANARPRAARRVSATQSRRPASRAQRKNPGRLQQGRRVHRVGQSDAH
jgi:hypothetical protein